MGCGKEDGCSLSFTVDGNGAWQVWLCGHGLGRAEQHCTLVQQPSLYRWFYSETGPSCFAFCLFTFKSCCGYGQAEQHCTPTVHMCSSYRWWGSVELYCTPPYNWTLHGASLTSVLSTNMSYKTSCWIKLSGELSRKYVSSFQKIFPSLFIRETYLADYFLNAKFKNLYFFYSFCVLPFISYFAYYKLNIQMYFFYPSYCHANQCQTNPSLYNSLLNVYLHISAL
jgi:hypothetical protein